MKKLLNRKHKGFTIVELVIVIAVIGILAGVLIPVFINLNNKANKAADEALVKNLNTALATQEQETGDTKNATFHDAVEDLKEYGYLLPNLVAKSDEALLWDRETNRFLLEEDAKSEKTLDYWRIQDNLDEQKYNIYAGPKFAATNVANLKVGFDAGDLSGLESVSYVGNGESAQSVVIRTNSSETSLTVNAPLDTVSHYDVLDELTVTAVAGASYHEYGIVKSKATISQGHIEVEQGAVVPAVSVKGIASGKSVKVTANENTIILIDEDSKNATSVVVNANDVFVDGAKDGSISGSKADKVKEPVLVMNEADLRAQGNGFAKLGADITFATDSAIAVTSKGVLNLNGHNISVGADVGDETQLYTIANGADLTVTGTGKITANSRIFYAEGSLRVESGTFVTTVLTDAAKDHASIIARKGSNVVIDGGDFYTAKANIHSAGNIEINGGTFTSIASSKFTKEGWTSGPYAYSILVTNDGVINGGSFYGIHGAIDNEGGKVTINNCYAEASSEALTRYAAVQNQVHYINHKNDVGGTITIDADYATANSTDALGRCYYALYIAGETGVVTTTVNGGEFVNKGTQSHNYAVLVGNSNIGDGGARLNAGCIFNGGTFTSGSGTNFAFKVNNYVGAFELMGGTFNKGQMKVGESTNKTLSDVVADGYRVSESAGKWTVSKK